MKRFVTALWVSLAGAGLAIGQQPTTTPIPAPTPTSERATTEGNFTVPQHVVEEGSTESTIWQSCNPRCTGQFTAGFDYLLWMFPKKAGDPINATDGSLANRVLVSANDERLDRQAWSGGRLQLGYWQMQPSYLSTNAGIRMSGAEVRLFSLAERSMTEQNANSPVILRPFFDLNNRVENAVVVAAPGLATGGIEASANMRMWGGEANLWRNVVSDGNYTVWAISVMGGLRFLEIDPQVEINTISVFANNLAAFPAFQQFAGNRIQSHESFSTRNRFVGGQVGLGNNWFVGQVVFDGTVKLGLGANYQELTIEGNQIRTLANGTTVTSQGALLALPSNIGRFTETKFSQVPEIDIGVTFPLASCLSVRLEFMAMYWSNVLRAREQIDREIDITQIPNFPGAAGATPTGFNKPGVLFEQSDLWILGVGICTELRW